MSESHTPQAVAAAVVLQIAGRPGPAFRLDPSGENVLGRSNDSLVALADRLASRQHAAIRFDDATATWMLRDLGSRNGTWLDGLRITAAPLSAGGQIRIGTTELVFQPIAGGGAPAGDDPEAGRIVRRGPLAELVGAALAPAAGGGEAPRWPMLLYQAGFRLLTAGSRHDVIGTTLEVAAEFTTAASFAWLEPAEDGGLRPTCVVPPGSTLAARVAGSAWSHATAGLAVWLEADSPGAGDVACVPLMEGGRLQAVLAAAGSLRDSDFDLLVSLAGLAGAAITARGSADRSPPQTPTTDPLDEAAVGDGPDDAPVDGTLALSAAELENLRSGHPTEWLASVGTLRLDEWERRLAVEALRRTGGNVAEAATLLGLSRATLYRRLDASGLTRPGSRPDSP